MADTQDTSLQLELATVDPEATRGIGMIVIDLRHGRLTLPMAGAKSTVPTPSYTAKWHAAK